MLARALVAGSLTRAAWGPLVWVTHEPEFLRIPNECRRRVRWVDVRETVCAIVATFVMSLCASMYVQRVALSEPTRRS